MALPHPLETTEGYLEYFIELVAVAGKLLQIQGNAQVHPT
jgi:hypothetical protein